MSYKKAAVGIILFFSLSGIALADTGLFRDVPVNHWAAEAISSLQQEQVVNGYSDGTFQPDKPVTRAEVAQMLYNEGKLLRSEMQKAADPDNQVINVISNTLPKVVLIDTGSSLGTGVFVDATHILTANHVVEDVSTAELISLNGTVFSGTVVARQPEHDLALVAFQPEEAGKASVIQLADSYQQGQTAIAIGHPYGLPFSVAKGIISSTDRTFEGEAQHFIQFDTAISPGNSGGPLIDTSGRMLGIITEKMTGEGVEGLGFAVPAEDVRRFLRFNGIAVN